LHGLTTMKKQRFTAVFAALLLGCMPMFATAGEVGISVEFSDKEVSVINAYYRDHSATYSQNGNGKKGNGSNKGQKALPPGIAKNLARGKPLPPGIAKRSLPYDLSRQLPAPRSGYEIIVVAGKVLLVEVATQIVRDVLTDALFS
jgi:hypothetical protein